MPSHPAVTLHDGVYSPPVALNRSDPGHPLPRLTRTHLAAAARYHRPSFQLSMWNTSDVFDLATSTLSAAHMMTRMNS